MTSKVQTVVQRIAQENVFAGPAVGYGGEEPEQYRNFKALAQLATTEELVGLLDHPHPVVRVYALQALTQREAAGQADVDLWGLCLKHLEDFERFRTFVGCMVMDGEIVADYFISAAISELDRESDDADTKAGKFKTLNLKVLDLPHPLAYRNTLLHNIEGTDPDYYPAIRRLAEQGDDDALLALSKFGMAEDLRLVEKLEEKDRVGFFELVAAKRKDKYKPKLWKYAKQVVKDRDYYPNEWRFFYRAVAAYEDDFSVGIFDFIEAETRNNPLRKYHLELMFEALREHTTGRFDHLFFTLWTDGKNVSVEIIDHLRGAHPGQTEALIQSETLDTRDYYMIQQVAEHMVRLDLELDREGAVDKMAENIRHTNVHLFEIYGNIGKEVHHPALRQAFEDRLAGEDNMVIREAAEEALATYPK